MLLYLNRSFLFSMKTSQNNLSKEFSLLGGDFSHKRFIRCLSQKGFIPIPNKFPTVADATLRWAWFLEGRRDKRGNASAFIRVQHEMKGDAKLTMGEPEGEWFAEWVEEPEVLREAIWLLDIRVSWGSRRGQIRRKLDGRKGGGEGSRKQYRWGA